MNYIILKSILKAFAILKNDTIQTSYVNVVVYSTSERTLLTSFVSSEILKHSIIIQVIYKYTV